MSASQNKINRNLIKRPTLEVTSLAGFISEVIKWRIDGNHATAFRGQRFYGWRAAPKIFRQDLGLLSSEDLAVRDIVSIHPNEFSSDNTMFDRLVRMQHFGMPTRLLDVTTNPLVALWFATEPSDNKEEHDGSVQAFFVPKNRQRYYDSDRVSCLANIANLKKTEKEALFAAAHNGLSIEEFNKAHAADLLCYYIGLEKTGFRPRINPADLLKAVYVKPKMSNKRIIAQSGAFLIYGAENDASADEGHAAAAPQDLKGKRLWIKEENKAEIREHLSVLGINESILFPEIDKAAKFITEQYGISRRGRSQNTLI